MSEPKVEVFKNGPIFVKGPLKYVNEAGEEALMERPHIALCRCGHSSEKRFCPTNDCPSIFSSASVRSRSCKMIFFCEASSVGRFRVASIFSISHRLIRLS